MHCATPSTQCGFFKLQALYLTNHTYNLSLLLFLFLSLLFYIYRIISGCHTLEVDPTQSFAVKLANIVPKEDYTPLGPLEFSWPCQAQEKPVSKDFVDDPNVPPLI